MLIGAAAGAVIAILTTPKPGREMRDELAEKARDAADKAREAAGGAGDWVPLFQRPEEATAAYRRHPSANERPAHGEPPDEAGRDDPHRAGGAERYGSRTGRGRGAVLARGRLPGPSGSAARYPAAGLRRPRLTSEAAEFVDSDVVALVDDCRRLGLAADSSSSAAAAPVEALVAFDLGAVPVVLGARVRRAGFSATSSAGASAPAVR